MRIRTLSLLSLLLCFQMTVQQAGFRTTCPVAHALLLFASAWCAKKACSTTSVAPVSPPPSAKLGLLLNLQATGSIRRFVHLPKPHLFYERPMMRLNLVHAPPIKACSMS